MPRRECRPGTMQQTVSLRRKKIERLDQSDWRIWGQWNIELLSKKVSFGCEIRFMINWTERTVEI